MRLSRGRELIVLALTGGIGSGKSLALDFFRSKGMAVFNADEIAKKQLLPSSGAYQEIMELFGEDIRKSSGEIDAARLGALVFGDEMKRRLYMDLLRPHIKRALVEEIEAALEAHEGRLDCALVEAPVLFEYGMEADFDYIILITAYEEERILRVMERNGLTRAEVLKRMESQLPEEYKRRGSHYVVENNGSKAEFLAQLEVLYQRLLALVSAKEEFGYE